MTSPSARRAPIVLVVDDMADTCEIYCLYLTNRGFKVPTARDGLSGIAAAQRLHPDVVVMDLSMPDLDGVEATRRLKADPRTSDIPVLILTAHPLLALQKGAMEGGADGFLTKPCLPEDLEKHVRQLLDRPPDT